MDGVTSYNSLHNDQSRAIFVLVLTIELENYLEIREEEINNLSSSLLLENVWEGESLGGFLLTLEIASW